MKPLQGFIADGETHALKNRSTTNAGLRSWCRAYWWRRDVREVETFRVTPGAPLCNDCIEAVEMAAKHGGGNGDR